MAALVLSVGSFACSSSSGTPFADGGGGSGGGGGAAGHDAATTGDGAGTDVALVTDASQPDSPASMTLTSAALAPGAAFLAENTCAGADTSPPLSWTAGPAGTMSYSVALTDLTIDAVHWIIWDIPAGTMSLPAALPGDTTLTTPVSAMQLHRLSFFGAGGAYRGPCPSGATHTYEFQVNAIASATLAGVTAASTSDDVQALAQAASLAHGNLNGTSNATAPPTDAGGQ